MTLLLFCMMTMLHPVHETVSEVEWNPNSRRLEVAIRLDVNDERWIQAKVSGKDDVSTWALRYLRSRFRIADLPEGGAQDPLTYRWVGRDQDGAHVWWYFEIEPADAMPPIWIDNHLLLDREPDFLNRMLILNHTPPQALNLTSEKTKARLDGIESDVPSRTTIRRTDDDNAPLPPTDL